jgi:archaellum component FlaC
MTDADPEETLTVTGDDVTVEKSFEPDDFPVPAIAFTIRSERDTTVSVRLVDTVPDDVAPENIGFHPKYGAEFWDVEDGRIVFQRDLAPGEEYTTVYGLRGGDADIAAKFMSEPSLESVDPPISVADDGGDVDTALDAAEIGDVTPPEGDTAELAVSDETAGSTNGSVDDTEVLGIDDATAATELAGDIDRDVPETDRPAPDDDPADDPTEGAEDTHSESDDRTDEPGSDEETPSEESTERSDTEPGDATERSEHDSLVSGLAAEIREGNVEDDDLMELRDALGLDIASASVEARVEHLQSKVSDLEAYTDALEAFLDEEGDAQTLIAEARDGYDEMDERIDELETGLEEIRSDIDERLDDIDEQIDETIDAELEEIQSELERVEGQIETESDARSELESEVEELSTDLAEVAEMRDRLTDALSGLAGSVADGDDADAETGTDGD